MVTSYCLSGVPRRSSVSIAGPSKAMNGRTCAKTQMHSMPALASTLVLVRRHGFHMIAGWMRSNGKPRLEITHNLGNTFGKRFPVSAAFNFRIQWRLVGIINPGKFLENARTRLAIKAFDIPVFAHAERRIDVDFNKTGDFRTQLVPNCPVWRNRGDESNHSISGQQIGQKPNSANIFVPVFFTESKV